MSISQAQVMDMLWVFFFFFFSFLFDFISIYGIWVCFCLLLPSPSLHPLIPPPCLVPWQVHLSLVPWKTLGLYSYKSTISEMKFRFGCRGCPTCNMNHKHQQCNLRSWFFFFSPRRKENKISESARVGPPSLLTYSEQRLGNLSPSEYCMKFRATYRACMET